MIENPGLELSAWQALNQKWRELQEEGHRLEIDIRLVTHPHDEREVLAVEVRQKIDEELHVQVFERQSQAAYRLLGLEGKSLDELAKMAEEQSRVSVDEERMFAVTTLQRLAEGVGDVWSGLYSSERKLVKSLPVDYRDYYVLKVLGEQMEQLMGAKIVQVRVKERKYGWLGFEFEYEGEVQILDR